MHRFAFTFIATILLASCSDWNWNKLNPLYLESELDNPHTPLLRTLPDGRDISGYGIPGNSRTTSSRSNSSQQAPHEIPFGTTTGNDNEVRSPYYPYALLDRAGHPSGTVVKDPKSMRTFRIP